MFYGKNRIAGYDPAYQKKYRKDNFEHLQEYQRGYRLKNFEHLQEYQKEYQSKKVSNKRWIYIFFAKDGTCLYVGSCKSKYRVKQHLAGATHLELNSKDWAQLELAKIVYADVTDITQNDKERLYIEQLYIDQYQPLLNEENAVSKLSIPNKKMQALKDIVYNQNIDFFTKKITLRNSRVINNSFLTLD